MNTPTDELSGGMKQRVLIGLALVLEPSLVILDEPTSALDALNQRLILDLVKGLQRSKGISVLFITHDISLVRGFADRTMILYFGRVMEIAQTERVMSDPIQPLYHTPAQGPTLTHGECGGGQEHPWGASGSQVLHQGL